MNGEPAGITISLPGDKSITHRALVLGALADGETVVENPLAGADIRSMAAALRHLGAQITPLRGRRVRIRGAGLGCFREPGVSLHCGNSGTAARFLLGLLGAHDVVARVTGDASLRRRPMRRVTLPLSQMGARFTELAGDGLPIIVRGGALRPVTHHSAVASAQVKSALLFAALVARVEVTVIEPRSSRDHTERMLRALGVQVDSTTTSSHLFPADAIPGFSMRVPGDPSSAAFLVGATLLAGRSSLVLEGVALNPRRTGFVEVLRRMGAAITVRSLTERMGEPVGDIVVHPSTLVGTVVESHEVPSLIDEIPLLAVLAAAARGSTSFHDTAELRVKESDRVATLIRNLRAVGVECEAANDTIHIEGAPRTPRGSVDTAFDHRIAMAFAVMGSIPGASVRLSETRSPQVSYPRFFEDLQRVVRGV